MLYSRSDSSQSADKQRCQHPGIFCSFKKYRLLFHFEIYYSSNWNSFYSHPPPRNPPCTAAARRPDAASPCPGTWRPRTRLPPPGASSAPSSSASWRRARAAAPRPPDTRRRPAAAARARRGRRGPCSPPPSSRPPPAGCSWRRGGRAGPPGGRRRSRWRGLFPSRPWGSPVSDCKLLCLTYLSVSIDRLVIISNNKRKQNIRTLMIMN